MNPLTLTPARWLLLASLCSRCWWLPACLLIAPCLLPVVPSGVDAVLIVAGVWVAILLKDVAPNFCEERAYL